MKLDKKTEEKLSRWFGGYRSVIFGCFLAYLIFLFALFRIDPNTTLNSIGDAANGISGPIISLISALLIYESFQAQLKANRIQIISLSSTRLYDEINNLKHLIKNLENETFKNLDNGQKSMDSIEEIFIEFNRIVKITETLYIIEQIKDDIELKNESNNISSIIESYYIKFTNVKCVSEYLRDGTKKPNILNSINRIDFYLLNKSN